MFLKILFYTFVKYYKSLLLFSVILSPFSLFVEWSFIDTLLESSNYGFAALLLSVLLNGFMYSIKCLSYRKLPSKQSFLSGGIRLFFYAIILLTAYNYELNMVRIYGEVATDDMIISKLVRHVFLNMMIVYELEMANKNYKIIFNKNLPIIGLLVKLRDLLQRKIIFKLNENDICPPIKKNKEE